MVVGYNVTQLVGMIVPGLISNAFSTEPVLAIVFLITLTFFIAKSGGSSGVLITGLAMFMIYFVFTVKILPEWVLLLIMLLIIGATAYVLAKFNKS
jgi:hypothetical protein